MLNSEKFLLRPWHSEVSLSNELIAIEIRSDRFGVIESSQIPINPSGTYAAYPEGVFVFLTMGKNKVAIGWEHRIFYISDVSSIEWKSDLSGRSFSINLTSSNSSEHFNYVTRSRNPIKIISDVLFPDDEWGLECDLPSFIHSTFLDGTLVDKLELYLKAD